MAKNADAVIELGSSDEEPEPSGPKPKRPKPNAMVSIPGSVSAIMKSTSSRTEIGTKIQVSPNVQNLIKNPFAGKQLKDTKKYARGVNPVNPQIRRPQNIKISTAQINKDQKVGLYTPNKNREKQHIKTNLPVAPLRNSVKILPMSNVVKPQNTVTAADMAAAKKILQKVQGTKLNQNVTMPVMNKQVRSAFKPIVIGKPVSLAPSVSHGAPVQGQKTLNKLPPGITVKRVTGSQKRQTNKRPPSPANVTLQKKKKFKPSVSAEVLTVELDDDDDEPPSQPSTNSPKWYVHPDDDKHESNPETNMEVENNKEPDGGPREMIEITIEDSPIKPPPVPQVKMASDLSIIIEDSPKKTKEEIEKDRQKDQNCTKNHMEVARTPKSKKMLNFPKETSAFIEVEVEFCKPLNDPLKTDDANRPALSVTSTEDAAAENTQDRSTKTTSNDIKSDRRTKSPPKCLDSNKIGKSPIKNCISPSSDTINETELQIENQETSPPISKSTDQNTNQSQDVNPLLVPSQEGEDLISLPDSNIKEIEEKSNNDIIGVLNDTQDKNPILSDENRKSSDPLPSTSKLINSLQEFNATYQQFINVCLKMEDSEDMNKILEKKVKEYYRQVDKSFTDSDDFRELVASKITAIKLNPDNLYLFIKDIVDELKMRRKHKGKSDVKEKEKEKPKEIEGDGLEDIPTEEASDPTNRNIRKLEKTLRKLHRAIQKLEEQEVDFDDDTDSVYLLTERYKERLVRVHAKLCQLTGTKMPSEPKITIEPRIGRPQGPTLRLERWLNKKVPIGAPLPFPDFHDVIQCVREANREDKLGWTEMEIMEEARDLFGRCGKKLQKRRQKNEWRLAAFRIGDSKDPAETSPELQERLKENKKVAAKKESDVINKYADRQNLLNLEAKEIADNDVEESAPSSDDEVQAVEDDEIIMSNSKKTSPAKDRSETVFNERISPNKSSAVDESKKNNVSNILSTDDEDHNVVTVTFEKENGESHTKNNIEKMDISDVQLEENPVTNKVSEVESESAEIRDVKGSEENSLKNSIRKIGISDSKPEVTANTDKVSETESESAEIRLILSDEDSNAVKSSEADGQSLLQERSDKENIASSLATSDSDVAIAVSDTQDSNENPDNKNRVIVSSGVVSIENSSSSDSDKNNATLPIKENNFPFEKKLLLEIDDSDDESGNIESVTGTEAENDIVSYENVNINSADEGDNTSNMLKVSSADIASSTLEDLKSHNENSDKSKETQETTAKSDGENSVKSLSDSVSTLSSDKCSDKEIHSDVQPQDIISVDTEKSTSRPVTDDNENDSSSENQNSDALIDIGPTIIQGADMLQSGFEVTLRSIQNEDCPDRRIDVDESHMDKDELIPIDNPRKILDQTDDVEESESNAVITLDGTENTLETEFNTVPDIPDQENVNDTEIMTDTSEPVRLGCTSVDPIHN